MTWPAGPVVPLFDSVLVGVAVASDDPQEFGRDPNTAVVFGMEQGWIEMQSA